MPKKPENQNEKKGLNRRLALKEMLLGSSAMLLSAPASFKAWGQPGLSSSLNTNPTSNLKTLGNQAQNNTFMESLAPIGPPGPQIDVPVPTAAPVPVPTAAPVAVPTPAPITPPSEAPTFAPVQAPTFAPVQAPTFAPVQAPTFAPVQAPTFAPVQAPTFAPIAPPTEVPTSAPTAAPTPPPIVNTWVGSANQDWNDSTSNWSRSEFPTVNHHVVIPNGSRLTIKTGTTAVCKTMDVAAGAVLDIQAGSIVTVKNP